MTEKAPETPKVETPPVAPEAPKAAAQPVIDINALKAAMKDVVQEEIKPLREKIQAHETAQAYGLNEEQLKAFQEQKQKGLADDDAYVLARNAKPDLFPQPRVPGLIAPGGASPLRGQPKQEDFAEKMRAAQAANDFAGATKFAELEFDKRIKRGRMTIPAQG